MGQKAQVGPTVAVIGGGNTAVDASRAALRLGASKVVVLYRRSRHEMPAVADEVEEGEREGVRLEFLTAPVEVLTNNGRVTGLRCVRMRLGAPDESGRRRPVPTGEEFVVEADTIVIAIGYRVDEEVVASAELECNWDQVVVGEETGQTSRPGVYAGGFSPA